MTRATIHDVAATAGVSVATVDRVLNNRAGVREVTRKRVHEAMIRLNYRPNAFAARLSKSKVYRFLFLVPTGGNPFMATLSGEIDVAANAVRSENILIERRPMDAFDGTALSRELESLSPQNWDGVAVVVPDLPLVKQAVDDCVARGIQVVTLVSDLPSSKRAFYVGIDNVTAGRVAGRLLGRFTAGREGKLAIITGSMMLSDHMERYTGCGQVVRANFPHLEMLQPVEGRDNADDTEAVVTKLLKEHQSGLIAIYNAGAGNRGLIAAVERSGRREDIVVAAHELSPHSRKALLEGVFDVILSQDAGYEVERAILLLRQLCDGEKEINHTFVRTDIFLPDNLS